MFKEKIEIALIKKNMSKTELAEKISISIQNLSGKIKRDNFSEKEMTEIVEALDAELILKIRLKDGTEI